MAHSGWRETTIGALCDEGMLHAQTGPFGSQLHSYDYVAKGIPVVPTEAIGRRQLLTQGIPEIGEETAARLSRHRLKAGDILFARRGVQATGLSALVTPRQEGWICGTGAILLRVTSKELDPEFLSFVLSADEAVTWLKQHAVGAVMPNLNEGVIRGLPLAIPPIKEQKELAAVLSALDSKIDVNRRMSATLEAMARALFQSWFVDFDPVRAKLDGRPPATFDPATAALFSDHLQDSPLGHIPKGWKAGTVIEGFNLTMGQSPLGDTFNEEGNGLPFYQGRTDFGFRFPTRRIYCTDPTRYAKPGDTLVSVRAPVGDINMANEECCIGRGVAAVRHRSGAASFTYHSMANLYPDFARFEAEGTVFGSINKDSFEKLRFVIPPDEIVAAYERQAGPLDEQIRALEIQSRTLAALRDTLLPKLLSGELSVAKASS
jgi:type I restriction enzyme S subunit